MSDRISVLEFVAMESHAELSIQPDQHFGGFETDLLKRLPFVGLLDERRFNTNNY